MKVKCEQCNKEFKMKVMQLEYIPDGKIIIEGFQCPHCHKEYITTVTDNKLREGIFRAKQLNDEIIELNRKQDKEYAAYMEDVGRVPIALCKHYAQQLEELQYKYRGVCRSNKALGKQLKERYCKEPN